MKSYFFLALIGIVFLFGPEPNNLPEKNYHNAPIKDSVIFEPGEWSGLIKNDSVCYFYYSKEQEDAVMKWQRSLDMEESQLFVWKVNGRRFTEIIKSNKKPLYKDSKLILKWVRNKNDLIIRKIFLYKKKEQILNKIPPGYFYTSRGVFNKNKTPREGDLFLYNTYSFLYCDSRVKASFSF